MRVIGRVGLCCVCAGGVLGIVPPAPVHAQTTSLASVGQGPAPANAESLFAVVSGDGRFVAFSSRATNLVATDTNDAADVFVRDLQDGTTTLVSLSTTGVQGTGDSGFPLLAAGGRYVVFTSFAADLVANDTNGFADVFVRDRDVDGDFIYDEPDAVATTRISVSDTGAQADRASYTVIGGVSADARHVTFASEATTLTSGDTGLHTDVFVHDRATGRTTRVSAAAPGAAEGNGDSFAPTISASGRWVAFTSAASNLVGGDTNNGCTLAGPPLFNCFDVFVHDRDVDADGLLDEPLQVSTVRASIATTGAEGNDMSGIAAISPDGRYVAFHSWASNLVPGDDNVLDDVFLRDMWLHTTTRLAAVGAGTHYQLGLATMRLSVARDAHEVAFSSWASTLVAGDTNAEEDVFVHEPAFARTRRISVSSSGAQAQGASTAPAISADGRLAVFVSASPDLVAGDTNGMTDVLVHGMEVPGGDLDSDGLPTPWEIAYGLDPAQAIGGNGADGDPDGDGLTNTQEYYAGTHPRGFHTRYLAEGATSDLFDTRLALLNVSGLASAVVRFRRGDGSSPPDLLDPYGDRVLQFNGLSRRTVDVKAVPGMSRAEFSTVVESDRPIVVDRLMTWDASGYGSHADTATAAPSHTWYLAEGATHGGFQLFYLLQNPNPVSVPVLVTYLRPAPAPPLTKLYTVGPSSRFNIWVNDEARRDSALAALAETAVSSVLASTYPIFVERAMYLTRGGVLYEAGHESAAVPSPAAHWFLAEGATGPYFDEFILVANPDIAVAQIDVRYLLPDGTVLAKAYAVPPQSRIDIWVNEETFPGLGHALAGTALSATIHSTNDVGVIVERAMWWPRPSNHWLEAHNSAGATATGVVWALAEGESGGPRGSETYILVANTSAVEGRVRVTLAYEGGGTHAIEVPLLPNSRTNVPAIEEWFPGITGKRFGALIESIGTTPAQIVVERAMYSNANGVHWAAGTNAVATRLAP